jgi:hypothetical protein
VRVRIHADEDEGELKWVRARGVELSAPDEQYGSCISREHGSRSALRRGDMSAPYSASLLRCRASANSQATESCSWIQAFTAKYAQGFRETIRSSPSDKLWLSLFLDPREYDRSDKPSTLSFSPTCITWKELVNTVRRYNLNVKPANASISLDNLLTA